MRVRSADIRLIAHRRERLRLTQEELARAVGERRESVSRLERALAPGGLADLLLAELDRQETHGD